MRDLDGVLLRASRTFSPHRVDEMYVNVSTALFIEAEDLSFGALEFFRVLDPRGRVVLYYSCEPTSSSDASSPLSVFDGASVAHGCPRASWSRGGGVPDTPSGGGLRPAHAIH